MNSVPFCINWKTKANHFHSSIARLLQEKKLFDVTIMCEGQVFNAHQLVLCICSEYFETVLQDVPVTQRPIIFLRDVSAEEFRYILDYMYKGEVILPEAILPHFFETCKLLHIKGLYEETQSESGETQVNKENSPRKSPPKKRKTKKRPQVNRLPKKTLLVNTDDSEDITLADLEANQTVIEKANCSDTLKSPPRSPESLVFTYNKLPDTPHTSESLVVENNSYEVIILSEDGQELRQDEAPDETQSDSYFTSRSADQITFMEGIELQEQCFSAKSVVDSDESEIIVRRKYDRSSKNKIQTDSVIANKEKAIQNAQNLKVVLPKISNNESSRSIETSDESEIPLSELKRPRLARKNVK